MDSYINKVNDMQQQGQQPEPSGSSNGRGRKMAGAVVLAVAVGALGTLSGCASLPEGAVAHPQDPWEGYNRSMMAFNDAVDDAVLRPAAKAYQTVTPQPVRTGVSNFFGNLGDLWSMVNYALQGKGEKAYNQMVRFTTNTTLGLGGLLDIATPAQIPREKQDFGQTLGHWGFKPGPYLVLPLLGPSTLRDTVALPVDWQGNVLSGMHPVSHRNAVTGLRLVSTREGLLGASDTLDAVALDRYSLMRDFYLRQRSGQEPDDANDGRIEDFDD